MPEPASNAMVTRGLTRRFGTSVAVEGLDLPLRSGEVLVFFGPNGSGKSNVADALRWVLGEQRNSRLRGDKSEELIFHGTEQKAMASLAEVALVLNNQNGHFDSQASEIHVSRNLLPAGDYDTLKHLDALLVAFFDLDVHRDGVARLERRHIFVRFGRFNLLHDVWHSDNLPIQNSGKTEKAS